jgi:iron complex outermembrane receptor protein
MNSSRHKFTFWFPLVAVALSPVYVTTPTLGQELEVIVVTARKRQESLQDVPIAVSAFTEDQIESAGIQRPVDFISKVPNVTIVDTANIGDTQVSIRGIVSTRDAESTFAYIVDGVLITNPNGFNEELLDVAQIEVLKGPQGALYGRNAVAGAVLVTTQEPGDEFEGRIKVGAGNNSSSNFSAMLSGPLSDSVRGRIAASYRDTEGFYDNIYEGVNLDVDYMEDLSVKGRLMFDVSDNFALDVRGGISQVEGGAINFNAVFAIPLFETIFSEPSYFADVNAHNFIYSFNVPGENEQDTVEFSIKGDWALNNMDLTATLAYNDVDEYLLSDGTSATFYGYERLASCQSDRATLNNAPAAIGGADRTDLLGPFFQPFGIFPPGAAFDFQGVYGPYTPTACDGYQYQERNQEDLSLELRLTSDEDQALRWIAGIYLLDIEREVVVTYGADTGQGFLRQPYVDPTGPNPTDLMFHDVFDTQVFAAFGQLEYDLSDTLELALALRYDTEDREVSNRVPSVLASGLNENTYIPPTFVDPAGVLQPINPAFDASLTPIPSRSRDFDQLQPKVSLSWRPNDNTNIYASYGVGFRSGGFNSVGSEALLSFWFNALGIGNPGDAVDAGLVVRDEYDKEVTDSFELGGKFVLANNRLRINAAVFRNEIEDSQFFEFFVGPFGLLRVVTTVEDVEINGFELDFDAVLTDNFSVFGGIGFLDSEIKQNLNRPLSVGNDAPQAPDETYNLGAQLSVPFGDSMAFSARVDWQHVGEMWFHTMQGEETETIWNVFFGPGFNSNFSKAQRDAFDTIDLRLMLSGEKWDFAVWGRNIGDEKFLEEVIPAPEFGGSFIHQAPGDAYGAEFTYRF